MQRVIRIVYLDFHKAFYLIDHSKLLENIKKMVVRSVLIRWFASYLNEQHAGFTLYCFFLLNCSGEKFVFKLWIISNLTSVHNYGLYVK